MEWILVFVEFFVELIVNFGVICFGNKQFVCGLYVFISMYFYNVIEIDQVVIDIGKDIMRKVGVEKY